MTTNINYVVDTKRWVQYQRVEQLRSFQEDYAFRVLSARQFGWLWKLGRLRKQPVVFSTWRIVHKMLKEKPNLFAVKDYEWFLGAVTSHSNIGGGLDPLNPIPNRMPEEAYRLATNLLNKFRVVTVNSIILRDLLVSTIPDVYYCPNGVNTEFFKRIRSPLLDSGNIRIGWVGKDRGPKNYSVVVEAINRLEAEGGFEGRVVFVDEDLTQIPLNARQMVNYYNNIDYYLCASWNEGTPNPALEAGACGIPIITTRVGNMPELIEEGRNGYFIDPTVDSIVDLFRSLKGQSSDQYSAMSSAIRESIVSNWSWQNNIGYFVAAFDSLIDKRSNISN